MAIRAISIFLLEGFPGRLDTAVAAVSSSLLPGEGDCRAGTFICFQRR